MDSSRSPETQVVEEAQDAYNVPFCDMEGRYSPSTALAQVGKPAPDFTLQTVDGEKVALSLFQGKSHMVLVFGNIT
jgi:peroxiredoxin